MPWTGKFEEALNGAQNPKRTMARLLDFYGRDQGPHPWWYLESLRAG